MKRFRNAMQALAACLLACGAGPALAQMEGPPPPDGPMQGLTRFHGRPADRFLAVFDLNHDGRVTRDEFNRTEGARFAAAAHGPSLSQDQFTAMHLHDFQLHTEQLFHRLDWNGDGRLTLDEYAQPQRVRFEMFDRDGKGSESCAPAGRGKANGFGRGRFCAENDLNHDGTVTRAEFDAATARRFTALAGGGKAMTPAQFAADALARYRETGARYFKRDDTNHDGKLSLAEYAAYDTKLFQRMDRNRDGAVTRDELGSRPRKHQPARG